MADPHKRIYPGSFGRDLKTRDIELETFRNEHAVIQLGLRSQDPLNDLSVRATELVSSASNRLDASAFRVRYPGLMPVDENGQYTPDPLFEAPSISLEPHQSQGVWIDLKVPREASPGRYSGKIEVIRAGAVAETFRVGLTVLPFSLPDPQDYHCFLNILVDPSSVARFNKLPLWGQEHWRQMEKYVADLAAHGQKTITAFIVDDPWQGDTGFPVRTLIQWKHAGEWTPGGHSRMEYDFSSFDRYVEMCLRAGIRDHIECWSPLVQPGSDHSVVTYTDIATGAPVKLRLPAGSAEYKTVWGDFARVFQEHLRGRGWLNKTYLAFDEISTQVLEQVVPLYREVAPDLKLMVSGGDDKAKFTSESRESAVHYGYTTPGSGIDMPDVAARRKAGKRTLLYTATTPIYPNTFIFSDPLESRYLGWIVWKWDFDGYIRWAWNFWPNALWEQPFYKWPSGDMFLVYPGQDGPVDSMRWEMLREGLEDYEALWMARQEIGKLREKGAAPEKLKKAEEELTGAVDLATQQFDRTRIPRDPIPARITEAREKVNHLLMEMASGDR